MRLGKAETAFIVFALVLCGIIVIYNAVSAPPLDTPVAYYQTSDLDSSFGEESDIPDDDLSSQPEQSPDETSTTADTDIEESSAPDVSSEGDVTSVNSSRAVINGKININTASKEELMDLDGIGEVFAERIIEYREKNGGFLSVNELKNVQGIGDKRFSAIKDNVTIG